MFCPGCGLEERESNQFCRACGADIRTVRLVLERPDSITASAVSARDEIGRAIAAKIRETKSAKDLARVTEEVLPQIEKFLESPEEKRLRRIRAGTILSAVGLGVTSAFTLLGIVLKENEYLMVGGLALIPLIIGLGFVVNGLLLTIPRKELSGSSRDAEGQPNLNTPPRELLMPEPAGLFSSVTENTTSHLTEKQPVMREKN